MLTPPPELSAQDNYLLRAWQRGELDDETRHAFETRLFLEPDLLRAAQLDQALREGMSGESRSVRALRRAPLRALGGLALAAGLAGLALWPLLPRSPETLSTGNVEWLSIDVRRGAEQPMLVAPRAGTRLLAVEIPAPQGGDLFDVTLLPDSGGIPPIRISQLIAEDGVLSLAFERAALSAGSYAIEVRPHGSGDSSEPLSRLSFRYRP